MQSQGAADNAAETARSETGVADEPRPVRYVAADEAVLYALYVPSGTPQYFIPRVQSAAIHSAFVHVWAVGPKSRAVQALNPLALFLATVLERCTSDLLYARRATHGS